MIYGRQSCDARKMEEEADIDLATANLVDMKFWLSLMMFSSQMIASS